jgi:SAM-dependent methyltransferase
VRLHKRRGSLWAGAGFVIAALSWLLVNEQGRRLRVLITSIVGNAPPAFKERVQRLWDWRARWWADPWGGYRRQLVSGAEGDVLEVGVGRWPNLRRYGPTQRLVGLEANRRGAMQVARRLRRFRPSAEIVYAAPEAMPFADASFDTVVVSLALCTVRDPKAALREIARVLRPGGTMRFLEHVQAGRPLPAQIQRLATPVWSRIADGCHLDRPTLETLLVAGFTLAAVKRINGGWLLARPTYLGVALPPSRDTQ